MNRPHARRRRRAKLHGLLVSLLLIGTLIAALAALVPSERQGVLLRPRPPSDSSNRYGAPAPPAWEGRKGIYLTSALAARQDLLADYVDQVLQHGWNALVIDVKDNSGGVAFDTNVALARAIGARGVRLDVRALAQELKAKGLYVIARHVVFYDPPLAAYLHSPSAPWVDPADARVIDYNLAIAREIAAAGVDEIQFDYLRYPDGGGLEPVYEARYRAIAAFLRRAYEQLHDDVQLSVDVFGRTLRAWNAKRIDPIGQSLEDLMSYADVLSPMVYPSHYENKQYRSDPYGTVKEGLTHGLNRGLRLRPFLQAFEMHLPQGMTQEQYIVEQLRAVRELGIQGHLFWNPEGRYDMLWRALAEQQPDT